MWIATDWEQIFKCYYFGCSKCNEEENTSVVIVGK